MLLLALAFHAGMLAIAISCILPVLPFAGNHGDTEERNQSNGFRMVNPLGFGEGSLRGDGSPYACDPTKPLDVTRRREVPGSRDSGFLVFEELAGHDDFHAVAVRVGLAR